LCYLSEVVVVVVARTTNTNMINNDAFLAGVIVVVAPASANSNKEILWADYGVWIRVCLQRLLHREFIIIRRVDERVNIESGRGYKG
jgi:hypothetical protein